MTITILGRNKKMKTFAITDFKAHALKILSQVAKTKQSVIITKRGTPMAEVIPFSSDKPISDKLSEALVFENDIVSPIGEDIWNACR